MKWIAIALGLAALSAPLAPGASLAPSFAPGGGATEGRADASIDGPKVLLIGGPGTSGSVRATGYLAAGFGAGLTVDVHSPAAGVRIRDVVVAPGAAGPTFSYLLEYEATSPNGFQVEITAGGGTGNTKDGIEKFAVTVKRL